MTTPITKDPIFTESIQSQSEKQPWGNVPVGGFVDFSYLWDSGLFARIGTVAEHIPQWSVYPAARDRALRRFMRSEPMLSGAVYSLSARLKALQYRLSGDEALHEDVDMLLKRADFNTGIRNLIGKTIIDLCTQDNGAFWELIGYGEPDSELFGGVVEGVNYLDSAQIYRTFDPEYPCVYINPIDGTWHRIHHTRIVRMSSMTQPNELARGIGFCPTSRVLLNAQLMQAITQYRYEKASGKFERAIGYGSGMTMATLRKLLQNQDLDDEEEGFVRFGKIPFYVSPRKEVELNILDLASIPDGFELMTETDIYVYILALCFGVDAREFWPATSSGATKADASIQNMKARGKGLADLITIVEDALNTYVMPADVTFEFDFVDDEHDRDMAQTNKTRVETLKIAKDAGFIDAKQGQAILIFEGVLDEKVLQEASQMVVEFDEQGLAPEVETELSPLPTEQPTFVEQQGEEETTPAQKTVQEYNAALVNTAFAFWDYSAQRGETVIRMDSLIRTHLKEAWLEAAVEANLRPGDITYEEIMELNRYVDSEQTHVNGLVDWIASNRQTATDFGPVETRMGMWANRYNQMKSRAMLLFSKNKKKQWKRGRTKHGCIDCVMYDGKVYRADTWAKHKIEPQSYDLTCRGLKCQCGFYDTDEPVDRGFPPAPRGRA